MPNVEVTEPHLNDPTAIELLQAASKEPDFKAARDKFRKFADFHNKLNQQITIRGLLTFDKSGRSAIPIEEALPRTHSAPPPCVETDATAFLNPPASLPVYTYVI